MIASGAFAPAVKRLARIRGASVKALLALVSMAMLGLARPALASTAYGSINNFDCVNDTGVVAHGFDIELDDIVSTNITYTYDYNHYGVPKITQDLSNPLHPKVLVRYASTKNPDGSWAAYTAIPSGPIAPTQGHQFTNPAVNFGGEHFGVGFTVAPSAVKYNWLIDDGAGNLVHGPPVYISTPTFAYNPPVGAAPANVVAAIVPPPPPAPPVYEFGNASWVKEIKTSTHNPNKVRLQDLVADDPGQPQPWANGEPSEVEVEWQILQTDFNAANGGKNGELQGAPEDLPGGDEVITRRYEFYKYVGPLDAETGEAVADTVAADGIHGVGSVTYADHFDPNTGEWVTITVDLSTVVIVGDFFGAQMAGFDNAPNLGLIDHLQDGDVNVAYPDRTVVVAGGSPFTASIASGKLPDGLVLNPTTGVLSGVPTVEGTFNFTVDASDIGGANVSKAYTMNIVGAAVGPVNFTINTSSWPLIGGTTSGGGTFASGSPVNLHATPNAGFYFVNWTEGGAAVNPTSDFSFTATMNRNLVANFVKDVTPPVTTDGWSGPAGKNGWYVGTVQGTLSATDDLSGVANTFFKIDGGAQQTYSAPFNVTGDGAHTVTFWSVDHAGNIENAHSHAVDIDSTAPALTGTANPAQIWPPTGKMVTVRVSGTITDLVSGVDIGSGTFATVDSDGKVQPSGSFTIGAGGAYSLTLNLEAKKTSGKNARTYRITIGAKDMAGNAGSTVVVVTVPHDQR